MTEERLKLQEKTKEGSDRSISDTLLLFYFSYACREAIIFLVFWLACCAIYSCIMDSLGLGTRMLYWLIALDHNRMLIVYPT